MKILFVCFLGLFITAAARAQMCMFDITTCTFNVRRQGSGRGGSWFVHNTNNIACSVSGISACSIDNELFATAIPGSPSKVEGRFCWCKMTHPRVGRWVYRWAHGAATGCAESCANRCADYVQSNAVYRAAVLALP